MNDPLVQDSQLMWRLATFKAEHPEVQIGLEFRARIPRPRGLHDVVRGTLPQLLDELEKMSPNASGQAGGDSARRGLVLAELPSTLPPPRAPAALAAPACQSPG